MSETGTLDINIRILASIAGGEETEVATAVAPVKVCTADLETSGSYSQVTVTAPNAATLTQAIKAALCDCEVTP